MINTAKGKYKDLKYLNRKLNKVVVLDFKDDHFLNNNFNVLKLS